ncbi:MAG: hypothetical protein ACI80N_003722, partial [Gammaproteobacteria bacterium]
MKTRPKRDDRPASPSFRLLVVLLARWHPRRPV